MCRRSRLATVHHRIYIMRGRKAKSLGSLHYAFTHGQTCASVVNGVLWARRIHRRASGIFFAGGPTSLLGPGAGGKQHWTSAALAGPRPWHLT